MAKDKDTDFDLTKEIDSALEKSEKKSPTSSRKGGTSKGSSSVAPTGKSGTAEEEDKSPMGKLLKDNPFQLPNEGDQITGRVVDIDTRAVYVDLGTLGAGVVYGKEIKDGFGNDRKKLKVGDEITAAVVDLENEDGYVELSISEAVKEQAWGDLRDKMESKEALDVRILDANKGGLMVEINGVVGFMPVSQLTAEHYPRVEDGDKNKILEILKSYIDTEMTVCVIGVDELEEKLIVSEKAAFRDREKVAIAELKVGDVIVGEVSGVVDFGAFVKFLPPSKEASNKEEDKLEGLVHISQLDWQLIEDPRKVIKVNDRVRAKIISIDDTRISLSIRELKNDPWNEADKKYKVGDIVKGEINKINHFGAFFYLDKDIHGLAHISSFPGYPEKPAEEVVKIGDKYFWEIMSMEPIEHRMGLKFIGDKKPAAKKEAKKETKKAKAKPKKKAKATKKKAVPKKKATKTKAKAKKATKAKAKPKKKASAKGGSASGRKKVAKKPAKKKAAPKKKAAKKTAKKTKKTTKKK